MKRHVLLGTYLLTVLAMSVPSARGQAQTVEISMCGGGTYRIPIAPDPTTPDQPDGGDCCLKACHAATDRRKGASRAAPECC